MKLNGVEKTIKHLKIFPTLQALCTTTLGFVTKPLFFLFAIALSWPLALHCLWRRQLFCRVMFSLATGSTVGEKGKKRGQTGKISANEASPAVAWGGGKGGTLSLPQFTSRLSSLADFFPFPPMRILIPGYVIFYFLTQREKWKSAGIDYLYLLGIGSEFSCKKLERKLVSSRNSFSSPLIFMAVFFFFLIYLGCFPFVRTDRPGHSLRNENCTFNQSYPARSVKS